MVTPAEFAWALRLAQTAWAAGVFEGEGTAFTAATKERRRLPRMVIYMTDEDVVQTIHETFGGYFRPAHYRRSFSKEKGHKPQATWMVSSWKDFVRLRDAMWPFLGARRREQLEKVLSHKPPFPPGFHHCSPDGTKPYTGGFYRHKRLGEPPCDNCYKSFRLYHNLYDRRQTVKRREATHQP